MNCIGKHDLIPEEHIGTPGWTIAGMPLWNCTTCLSFVSSKTAENIMMVSRSVGCSEWFREAYSKESMEMNIEHVVNKVKLNQNRTPCMVKTDV
jgi:hypothetical protein